MVELNDVHEAVQATYRDFADKVIAPGAQERDQKGQFPYDLVAPLADIGVFRMVFPEEVGGDGGDTVSFVLALEEIARADQSVAALVANQVGLSALPIATFGTADQKERWLPGLFSGEVLGSFGLTEPGGGSDTASMRTRAAPVAGGWVLNGTKTFITNAGTDLTGFVTVAAVTGQRPDGRNAAGTFIVETSSPGFSVGRPLAKLGWRASDTREVFLDDCFVPDSNLLGPSNRGLAQFLGTLDFGRIQIATLGVGLIQAALDASVAYARERRAFGQEIARFQGVAFKLADLEVDAHAARLLTLEAARRRDAGLAFAHEAAIAKLYSSEAAMRAAHQCVQVHGGAGFMDDSEPARLFRDAKVLEIGEGTSEIQRLVISRNLTKVGSA
jgi:alkylation response protein AidB-like acyl-CoA dehydrogenase